MKTLALIGTGRWGLNYLKTIEKDGGYNLKYICSPNVKLKKINNKYIKFEDFRDFYKYNDIDGIIIATPSSTHFKIASYLLKKNFNLLIEKPFMLSMKDVLKVKEIYNKSKSKIMVGNIFEYNYAFLETLNQARKLGKVSYIQSQGLGDGSVKTNSPALWEWAYHDVYMVLSALKSFPVAVSGWEYLSENKIQELVTIRLIFKNNVHAYISSGGLSQSKKRVFRIFAKKGEVIFDDLKEKKIFVLSDSKKIYPSYNKEMPLSVEVKKFIDIINKPKGDKELEKAVNITKILDSVERSIKNKGKLIYLKK